MNNLPRRVGEDIDALDRAHGPSIGAVAEKELLQPESIRRRVGGVELSTVSSLALSLCLSIELFLILLILYTSQGHR
jgi:hypothetical protein